MSERPNILFILTDQHRGDCIGADPCCPTDEDGRSLIHTPNINHFVESGALFARAYSPSPTSVPARRCLWTGQTPATNGCPAGGSGEWAFEHTLPHTLRNAGYQTWLTGKTHSRPPRNHFGFEGLQIHSGLAAVEDAGLDDYANWLEHHSDGEFDEESHGLGRNGWDPRPWHLPERFHPTHWTTTRAIDFLETKCDPTRPFFLTLSYVRPHQPYDPPQAYWDMYIDRNLPDPHIGAWATERYGDELPDHPATDAWCADLPPTIVHRAQTGYYGSITHIDQQIKRIIRQIDDWGNTFVIMASDHGDMLGDHHLWRKGYAYEGSARVPLLLKFPVSMDLERGQLIDQPVGLEDIMPTILDIAGIDSPETVEGRSLCGLLEDRSDWRNYYHGELGPQYASTNAMQYLVSEDRKFIWNPVTGNELLFDLRADPHETRDLSGDPDYREELQTWRDRLIERLQGREEGFSDGTQLLTRCPDVWE